MQRTTSRRIVAFDTSFLIEMSKSKDSLTRRKIDHIIDSLIKDRAAIIIPAPVYAEFFVKPNEVKNEIYELLSKSSALEIRPFDTLCGKILSQKLSLILNKKQAEDNIKNRIKFDWMIGCIAHVNKAQEIFACDKHLQNICDHFSMKFINLVDMPDPAIGKQIPLLEGVPLASRFS
ncbi:MAG: PIN domain-containing protein [Candidatus Saccharibacteria bacterium]|nr:PIN domain-containing protein [Moraxellaceae bacterium]